MQQKAIVVVQESWSWWQWGAGILGTVLATVIAMLIRRWYLKMKGE